MKAQRVKIGREREKRNDTSGENGQNWCINNAKTNSGKIASEENCMNETDDVKERQRMGERRWDRRSKRKT